LTPDMIVRDPAFAEMTLEIITNLLSHAENPGKLGEYLTPEIRELTGARCVILTQCQDSEDGQRHRIIGVNPGRRRDWSESSAAGDLYGLIHALPDAKLWHPDEPSAAAALLQREGFGMSISIPLNVGTVRVGEMVLLGLPEQNHLETEVKLLKTLSTMVALVLRNTFLFENQEKIIRERTNELSASNNRLRQSEARFRALTETAPDAIISSDGEGRITFFNQAASLIFGYEERELLGRPIEILMPERFHASHRSAMARGSGSCCGAAADKKKTLFAKHRDGSEFPIELSLSSWSSGDQSNFTAIIRDITVQLNTQGELLKTQKLESLSILAGGIAHDFNNIITGIMGNVSFARMFLDESHKAAKLLAEAEKASARAAELANQLLTFSRGGEPVKRVFSLQHLVREVVSLLLRGTSVRGVVEIPESIHAVEGDEGQIGQVFTNLIINASQAMPGGGTLTVKARNIALESGNSVALPTGNYVGISFTDEGCGIAAENLKKIFDPFFTTKVSGTGLGLASAYSIMKKHGGDIEVRSEFGSGATFTCYLPSTGKASAASGAEESAPTPAGSADASILVMDDDEAIRDLARDLLECLGYGAETCGDGAEAISMYREAAAANTPYAAVIMDLTIPGGMGGREAAERILAIDPEARLLVSSGYSNDPVLANYEKYGFSGAVAKPYRAVDLKNALNSLLKQ